MDLPNLWSRAALDLREVRQQTDQLLGNLLPAAASSSVHNPLVDSGRTVCSTQPFLLVSLWHPNINNGSKIYEKITAFVQLK